MTLSLALTFVLQAPDGGSLADWKALARTCEPPPGRTAVALVTEAITFLGSPDPAWRDEVGYGMVESCVIRKERLSAAERRAVTLALLPALESPDGGVLRRSFSALDLSLLAAAENAAQPALDDPTFHRLVSAGLASLGAETDLRGLDPEVGWVHATAHTADLLKFLARNPRFSTTEQQQLLDAAWARMTRPGTPVFTAAEDERLAAAVASIIRRPDFQAASLGPWLTRFVELEKSVWATTPPLPRTLDAAQNARNLLQALHLTLAMGPPRGGTPSPAEVEARAMILRTLTAIRRT